MNSWLRLFAVVTLGLCAAAAASAQTLDITGITASPAAPKPGDTVTYTVTFTNSSTTTASVSDSVQITISSKNSVTGQNINSYSATTVTVPAIAASGTASVTVQHTVPLQTSQAGASTVTASVTGIDAGTNSAGVTTFTTTGNILTITGKPDLKITSLSYPASTAYKGGDTISMSLTYTNLISTNGVTNVPYVPGFNGDGGYFRIEVILSSNPTFGDGDDFLLTYHDVSTSPLNANGNDTTISWTQLLPGNFAGSYYVLAKIDTTSAVSENVESDLTSTGNNVWFSPDTNAARITLLPTTFPTIYAASSGSTAYSDNPSVSGDGRHTVYASDATGLVTGDTNGKRDIFLYDNQTSTVRRVSQSQQGAQPNGASNNPALSVNGTYVAFSSEATNLSLDDTNGFSDIYVVNVITGAIVRASVPNQANQGTLGTQANGASFKPAISSTGRYVVFESSATNLVSGGTTAGVTHIYRLDRDVSGSGTFDTSGNTSLVLISQSSGSVAGNGSSIQATVSGDGRYVAYASDATNLVAGDTNSLRDIFLRDVTGGTTTRISVATGGTQATGGASRAPSINQNSGSTDDGRYIAFGSEATNLVAGDTNGISDIFVHDRTNGTTVRVSVSSTGTEATDPTATANQRIGSINPSISSTGRYVAFASLANNLTDGDNAGQYANSDSNSALDIFVHDRDADADGTFDETGGGDRATTMVSRNRFGFQTAGLLGTSSTAASDVYPVISGNGRYVAFPSDAENTGGLVHGATNRSSADSNTFRDIYLHDRRINALPSATTPPSVSITSPVTGTSYPVNSALTLVGSASASAGTVASVQFFVNGTSLGTDTTFPYNATWTPTATGTFALSALVTDSFGNQAVSSNINITISAVSPTSPSVSITSPSTGSSVFANGATTVSASASDTDGTIASVAFYANNVLIGTDTTFPYSVSWTPTATGSYTLTAVATDNGGNQTTTTGTGNSSVTVVNLSAPTISITSPTPVQINSATTITATTSTSGSIANVQFLANGTSLGTITTAPFVFNWTPTAAGTYTLSAVATDNLGSQTTSSTVSVTVSAGASPVVSITSPAAGTVNVNTQQTVSATATDSDGTVTSVRFLVNGAALATLTAFPYATTWTPTTAGTYTLQAIATDNLGNTTTSSSVSVTVTSGTAPTVSISSPAAGTINVNSTNTITASATANSGTITGVEFFANGISLGTDTVAPYTATFTPIATGTYSLTAVATDTLGNRSTSAAVAMTVVANALPTVSVTAPTSGASVTAGSATTLTATAADSDGTIARVQFFVDGVAVGSPDTTSPYSASWTPARAGSFTITATAVDNLGASTTSAPVTVNATTTAATVSITSPVSGATLPVNVPQTITATATASSGTIVSVEFFANGASLGNDTTFPFAVSWTPVTTGAFALVARATDNFGTVTDSSVLSVSVTGGSAPTVSISTPLTGSSAVAGTTVPVVVNAAAVGSGVTVASVELFANNVSIGSDTTFPYNFSWAPTGVGNVSLTAVAVDSQGNRTVSSAVTVTVSGVSTGAPAVAIVAPAAGASLPVGASALIAATATDADGTIAQVEFFANGASLGVDSTFPYTLNFVPNATGNYVLTARATDNGGNVTTSAAVNITVSGGSAPSVAITAPTDAAILGVNAPVTVTAAATSSTGFIRTVEFLLNGAPLATDNTFPYAATWTPTALGTSTLTARATDNLGNISDSAIVTVTVGASAAPTVAITNPATGSAYTVGTPLTVAATAADSDGSITQVQFLVNGAPLGAADTVSPYSAVWTATSVGVYTLTAQATDNSGNVATSSQVIVTIGANAAPTVELNSPAAGTYSLGNLVLVSAQANDADGTVSAVQFFANGLAIGTVTTAPFNVSWRPTVGGTYAITAQATDNAGNVTVTTPVNVTITAVGAPSVAINNPVAGQVYGAGTAIPFTATPAGGNGPVAQVQFFVNGAPLGAADTTSPYSATWTPGAPGTYSLLAIATDSAGLSSSSSATLAVTIAGNNPPTVAITNPSSGTSVNGGTIVNLTAAAADSDGTVASVRFLANGIVVGSASAVPFTAPWVPSAAGTYTVTAQATDNSGNVTNSAPISVTVVANRAPIVSLTAPGNGATVRVSSAVNLTATASDPDGTIAGVQFLANGLAVGAADTTAPYTAAWTPGAEGIYRITAIALDNSGAATTSTTVTVLAVVPGANGADVIYTGQYQGLGESGRFAAINVRGSSATFIAYSTQPAGRVYFYSGMEVDATGGFARFDDLGRTLISGTVTDTGAVGTLDGGRVTFIGTVGFGTGAGVASGYYNGGLNGRPDSNFTAIVGPDGSIAIYAIDGSFRDAGSGTVAANGNFTVTTQNGVRFVGRVDPASGFLTGSITGGPGGGFMAALSSGVSFSDGFLRNLSTRGQVGTGANILFAGFVISGDTPKQVLVRAIGPSLTAFGVAGALADTQLQLFNGNTLLQTNDNWGGNADISAASNLVGAFPLQPGSRDSALLATLAPGTYTAQVSGVGGTTGVALVELYDTDTLQPFAPQKVTNVATRGVVGTGANQLIAGFVVTGNTAKKVLIRAVGPTLGAAPFNVGGVLSDPSLRLVQGPSTIVRENDNWETGNDPVQLRDAAVKVGAFPLAAGSRDAAMLINLPPGAYSAQVTGAGTSTGIALVEVYEVP